MEFRKNSFNDSDSAILAKVATTFQNVSDEAMSASDSASFIIAQMKAFNIEAGDAEHIIDAVNAVSNNYAVSSGQLAQNLGNMSAAMAVGNNTFEESLGMLTAMTEITRSAAKGSRALVTVQGRLNQIVDESSDTGKALTAWYEEHGIAVKDAEGQIRSLYDVLTDVAEIWPDLTKNEQMYYLQQQAGTTQTQNLSALLQNFNTAITATETAIGSTGSAMRENEAYMDSIEAKTQQLKATFEDFANRVLSKEVVTGFLDAGNAMLQFADTDAGAAITRIVGVSTALTSVVGIIGTIIGNLSKLSSALSGTGGIGGLAGLLTSPKTLLIIGGITAGVTALVEVIKAIDDAVEKNKWENLVDTMNESNQELEDTKQGYEDVKKKLDELNNTPYDGKQSELEAEREQLQKQIDAYEHLIELQQQETVEAARKVASKGSQITGAQVSGLIQDEFGNTTLQTWNGTIGLTEEQLGAVSKSYESVQEAQEAIFKAFSDQIDQMAKWDYYTAVYAGDMEKAYDIVQSAVQSLGITVSETKQKTIDWAQSQETALSNWATYSQRIGSFNTESRESVEGLVTSTKDYYDALKILSDNGENLDQWQKDFIDNWEYLNGVIGEFETSGASEKLNDIGTAAEESASKLDTYIAALEQYRQANDNASDSTGVLVDSLFDANGQLTEAAKAALAADSNMASMSQSFINAQIQAAQANYSALIIEIEKVGSAAVVTSAQIASMMAAAGVDSAGTAMYQKEYQLALKNKDTSLSYNEWMAKMARQNAEANYKTKMEEYQKQLSQISSYVPSTGGGGGSSSTKKDQEEVKTQTIKTIEELREYLTDESTRLKLIDPDINKSDLKSTLSEVATIYQSYQDYLSSLKQQGFDETSEQYQQAEAEFAQFVETLKTLFAEIVAGGKYDVDELVEYITKNCGYLSDTISGLIGDLETKATTAVSNISQSIHQAFASGDANSAIGAIENAWDMIRSMSDGSDILDDAISSALNGSSAESEAADELAEKYEWQNKLLEDKIKLEEKLEALERAKQRRMLVYSEGRFQYMQDADAISSALSDYQGTRRDVEQSQIQELISKLGKENQKFFSDYFSNENNTSASAIRGYGGELRDHLMDMLKDSISGSVFEDMSDSELYDIFGEAMKPGESYDLITSALIAKEEAAEAKAARKEELKKYIREENVKNYGVDTDFGEKIKNAQSQAEVEYWTKLRDTKLEMIKDYREAYGDEAASKYFGTDVSKMDTWKSNQDLYKEAYEAGSKAWETSKTEFERQHYVSDSDRYTEKNPDLTVAQYNAATAIGMEGLDDGSNRIYNKIFSGSITKSELQDLYNKAESDRSKGYLLNLASEMYKAGYSGYARGTKSASGGLSVVGENGPELRVLNSGDGIIPSNLTENLWRWGSMTPMDMLQSLAQKAQSMMQTLNISNVTLPNVRDAQSFVSGLREYAQQYVTRRN